MTSLDLGRVERILCLGAHPDDIEIGCGGTVLRLLAEAPRDVTWVVFSGAGERSAEARRGAERFLAGARSARVEVHDHPDARFPWHGEAVKDRLHALASELSPDLVLTHRLEDRHQDHRLVAELTWQAFRDHWILEYEIPKYEGDLGPLNVLVDLDEETCARKVAGIVESHPSQAGKPWFSADAFWALLRLRGVEAGRGGWAEGFHGRKLVL